MLKFIRRFLLIVIGISVFLSGCASEEISETTYTRDFRPAYAIIKELESMVNGRLLKEKYFIKVDDKVPKAEKFFKHYKGSEFEKWVSFKELGRALDSYVVAKQMWNDKKGLVLIRTRWDEAKASRKEASKAFAEETGIKLENPDAEAESEAEHKK